MREAKHSVNAAFFLRDSCTYRVRSKRREASCDLLLIFPLVTTDHCSDVERTSTPD